MKIADNIKCKDFEIRGEWAGSRLEGQENLWIYRIYYKGQPVRTKYPAHTKAEARAIISEKVRKVNAVLNKARKLEMEGKLEEATQKDKEDQ